MSRNVYWGTHSLLADNGNATLLGIGDSWFWYPFDNLAVEVAAKLPNHTLLIVGRNGAEAADWATRCRKDIDFAFRMFGTGVQALLLSGGGNDIAGINDFTRLLQDDCSKAKKLDECWREGEPSSTISAIEGHYRALIARFRGWNPNAPVVVHHYDHAWPSGEGLFGPADWLKAPMDRARVPAKLRREMFKALVLSLKAAQERMAADPALGVIVANTAGVLPEDDKSWWANELHPTPAGFRLLARKAVLPALRRVIV
jgi:hypothetical protein